MSGASEKPETPRGGPGGSRLTHSCELSRLRLRISKHSSGSYTIVGYDYTVREEGSEHSNEQNIRTSERG